MRSWRQSNEGVQFLVGILESFGCQLILTKQERTMRELKLVNQNYPLVLSFQISAVNCFVHLSFVISTFL
jgi:hypothetical protein